MGWRFCRLESIPNADINNFDCGDGDINLYLQKIYSDPENADYSRNFIMVDEFNETNIVGFYTLSSSNIPAQELPDEFINERPYPCPAILIGQFGIDRNYQGQKLSRNLLWNAYRRIIISYQNGDIAFKAIRVDTPNEKAKQFWKHQGFVEFKKRKKSLFLPIQTLIRELEEN